MTFPHVRTERGVRWNSYFPDPPDALYDIAGQLIAHDGTVVVWAGSNLLRISWVAAGALKFWPTGRLEPGPDNQCHATAAQRHHTQHRRIGTGWALSDDGLWRAHSWNFDVDGTVVEPTTTRLAYGGIALNARQTDQFIKDES